MLIGSYFEVSKDVSIVLAWLGPSLIEFFVAAGRVPGFVMSHLLQFNGDARPSVALRRGSNGTSAPAEQ